VLAGTKLVRDLYCQDMVHILQDVYNSGDWNASAC
jgi:hypothetical protein